MITHATRNYTTSKVKEAVKHLKEIERVLGGEKDCLKNRVEDRNE